MILKNQDRKNKQENEYQRRETILRDRQIYTVTLKGEDCIIKNDKFYKID